MGSPGPIDSTSDWTFACWMKVNSSHYGCLFSQRAVESSAGIGIFYYKTQWIIDDGVRWRFTPITDIQPDTWYHICVVRKSGVGKYLYVNGTLDSSTDTTGNPTGINPDYFAIGNSQNSATTVNTSNQFSGFLNDVRVYDHALSAKEIHILAQGLVMHYQLNRESFGMNNLIKNGHQVRTSAKTVLDSSGNGSAYVSTINTILDPGGFAEGDMVSVQFDYEIFDNESSRAYIYTQINGSAGVKHPDYSSDTSSLIVSDKPRGKFSVTYRVTEEQARATDATYIPKVRMRMRFGTVGAYFKIWNIHVEKGPKTPYAPCIEDDLYSIIGLDDNTIVDVSGYQHNGTLHNITYSTDTPKYNLCSEFTSANNSYVKCNDSDWMAEKTTDITINFWASTDDWTLQTSPRLFSCTEGGGFNTEGGSSGYIRFPCNVYTDNAGTKAYKYTNTFLKLSDLSAGFHMFTFIYNTTGQKLYIDGELYNDYPLTSYGLHFNKNARLFLGCEANVANPSAPYTNMKMSDFRIYATTLSPESILELYNSPISLANTGALLTNGEFEEE